MVTASRGRSAAQAADPRASVWVAASAGTGKTRVLTERLLQLLVAGTDPARILCLTFTRAAAAEMANRLNSTLAGWATLSNGALAQQLCEFSGGFADEDLIARARRLFALVLDAPGGIKISTIHSFCQTLLRRFPLEAHVAPEFVVIEERGAAELLAQAAQRVIIAARSGADAELRGALAIVADHTVEERFGELMQVIAQERGRLREALSHGHQALRERLSAALGVSDELALGPLVAEFCAPGSCDEAALAACAPWLAGGKSTDRKLGKILSEWCAAPERRQSVVETYVRAYLNDERSIKRQLATKDTVNAAREAGCDIASVLAAEAERVCRFDKTRAALVVREATCALVRLGERLLREYDAAKRLAGVLDFDDLVASALDLLRRPDVAPWVLFKLDGLDHILIDEAQDTNPDQWQIVAALAEEFFVGEGARSSTRTVFAVGDTKQSIFSFQRADPQAFLQMRRHFQDRVTAARQLWVELPLDVSFRSTEPVLQAVDAIFRRPEAYEGVALDGHDIRHFAERTGHAGTVELWPAVASTPGEEPDDEELPVAYRRVAEPRARLARAIAATIAQWLANGDRLEARDRSLHPGDVMVLVRRRDQFVGELLRALKQRGIPVAGADRLVLTEQLAVQDLIAVGRFLLLPEDDLTLAAVLKSPLFDLDEETLFDLCYGRGEESLWNRLRLRAQTSRKLRPVADRLAAWLARADFVPPYELYASILGAEGGRRALIHRLGPEAEDPIEELLLSALAYEREQIPSLQGFLRWLTVAETEAKRDFAAHPRDEVRILTVHGAKGLEAPVVFLPDTTAIPDPRVALLWSKLHELPLWKPPGDHAAAFYAAEKSAWRNRQLEEYRRLLYVALTRAQDRLYICGWHARKKAPDICWHTLCQAGLRDCAEPFAFDTRPLIGEIEGWSGEGLRLKCPQTVPPQREPAVAAALTDAPAPDWAIRPPPPEPHPSRPLFPSQPAGDEPPILSPLKTEGRDRFKCGLLIHRLLQNLPQLPAAEREGAARRFLALPVHALPADEQDDIRRETLAVLEHPGCAALFGPNSKAEVPLVGSIDGYALSGQIDRLVVDEHQVLIVDYKTIRPMPQNEDEVAPLYLRQLAIYREALARIYPGREIQCALLWTQGPRLMTISAGKLTSSRS